MFRFFSTFRVLGQSQFYLKPGLVLYSSFDILTLVLIKLNVIGLGLAIVPKFAENHAQKSLIFDETSVLPEF